MKRQYKQKAIRIDENTKSKHIGRQQYQANRLVKMYFRNILNSILLESHNSHGIFSALQTNLVTLELWRALLAPSKANRNRREKQTEFAMLFAQCFIPVLRK